MSGGLYDPLGADRAEAGAGRPAGIAGRIARLSPAALAAGAMLAGLALLLLVSWLRDTGDRGLPVAVGIIEHAGAPAKPPAAAVPQAPPIVPAAPAAATDAQPLTPPLVPPMGLGPAAADQDVEIQNGVRIVRPHRDPSTPGAQAIPVPRAAPR